MIAREDIYLVVNNFYEQQCATGFVPRRQGCTPWPLRLPLDWAADPFHDRNWCAKLQQWRMTDPILARFFDTRDRSLLREALAYALDWHRFHMLDRRPAGFDWADATVGIRALRIAFFAHCIATGELQVSDDEHTALLDMADEHARRLQDPSFITLTNHGIFQIFGLNLLCKALPDRESTREGRAFATRTLLRLFDRQFDKAGVHRENSPAYHFFANKVFQDLGVDRHFDNPEVKERLKLIDRNEKWLVFPDGRQSRAGDSEPKQRPNRAPKRLEAGDLTSSGYAIVRSASSMIFVTGMAHVLTHKHADELSFELFEHGRMIFIDSGKYGYRRDDKRDYVCSAAAHNTIGVLERDIGPRDVRLSGTLLQPIERRKDRFVIAGRVDRPGLFRQNRRLIYAPGRFLVICDSMRSDRQWTYVSSLHFATDLVPRLSGRGFEVDGGLVAAELVTPGKVESFRGHTEPMLGWEGAEYNSLVPTSMVRATTSETAIRWAIWFTPDARTEALGIAARGP